MLVGVRGKIRVWNVRPNGSLGYDESYLIDVSAKDDVRKLLSYLDHYTVIEIMYAVQRNNKTVYAALQGLEDLIQVRENWYHKRLYFYRKKSKNAERMCDDIIRIYKQNDWNYNTPASFCSFFDN